MNERKTKGVWGIFLFVIILFSYKFSAHTQEDYNIERRGESIMEMKQEPEGIVATLNTAALAVLLNARTPLLLIDARGENADERRIPGARDKALHYKSSEEEITSEVGTNKNTLIVAYCGGLACPASKKFAARLKEMGYQNVIVYPEGISGWVEAGNQVSIVR